MRSMRDRTGGIEGMPLQLMIVVIVAGLVLAVVLGWTFSIQGPAVIKRVNVDPETVNLPAVAEDRTASRTLSIHVTAFDGKDQPLQGIVVTLGGAVARTYVAQDSGDGALNGTASLRDVQVTLPPGIFVGELTLTIQKAGFPSKTWSIPVVRGA